MRHSLLMIFPALCWCLTGCGDEPASNSKAAANPAPQTEQERQINNTQAASVVGYDGDALKRSVQKTVNNLENHTSQTQAATDSAAQAEPDASK